MLKKTKDERIRYLSLLAEEILEKRLAVFVGAGCSMSLGLPSWVDLIEGLLEKYNIKSKERDVFRLASRLERELGPLKLREEIAASLRVNEIGKSDLHDALVNLETNLFITTNYDTLLEDYFKLKGISPSIIVDPKDIPSIAPTRKTIVKLHGDLNSPASLVITAADYTRYKSEDKAFIDWLNSVAVQRSILFVGASFDDPRLKDVDDYVLNIFGSGRGQPFIFSKIPTQSQGKPDEDFAVELDDFEARCDDFRDRGFYLIPVEKYEEIAGFLKEVSDRVLQESLKADPGNLGQQLKLKDDYSGKLEKSLEHLIDEKIQELVKKVLGEGRLPGIKKIKEGMEELREFLNNPPHRLEPESRLHGLLCMTEAFLIIANTKADIIAARRYYDSAGEFFQELDDKSKFQERLIRIRAKLLFEEGETEEAINSLSKSTDPRTISFWLLYLTEAKRYDEAFDFIEKNEVSIQWVSEALRIYIIKGKIPEAERLFWKFHQEFEAAREKGNIEDTEYKGDFFFDRICFVMIYAIYFKALELSGVIDKQGIYIFNFVNLSGDSRQWLEKSLEFIDLFFDKRPFTNPGEDYRVIQIISIEMNICSFLFNFERANEAAKKLTMIDPIKRSVVEYILNRGELFPDRKDTLQRISKKLAGKDFRDQAWAWSAIAHIEMILGNIEKSFEALQKTIPLIKENEKSEILKILLVGSALVKLDEVFILIKRSFRFSEEENCFWEGVIKWLSGNTKEAFEKISKIDILNYPEELKAVIPNIKGQLAIENQNWEEARKFLEEVLKLYPNPETIRALLFVLTKLQDAVEVLRLAEKLEYYGTKNDQITFIKAEALRNLRQFEKSAELLRELNKKSPGSPQYAFVLAQVLFFSDKESEAKQVLNPFLQPGEKFDMNCLKLALEIHSTLNESEVAFRILDNCWDEIQEQPDLIWKHVELAFKTNKEKEAQKSLKRMEVLKEEGKITDMVFFKSDNLEDIINLTKKRQETIEQVQKHYVMGEIPRIKLCEILGSTLYLDWAIRTQPLSEDFFALKAEAEFTIYSTKGFKLSSKDKISRFSHIEAPPKEAKEIVIDYHALITLHRLGFIGKLCKRYEKIYYPDVFKRLWKMEQTRYTPFQLSRVKVYKKLAERLGKHEIKKFPAPKKESMGDRDLSLAQKEKIPLIDNYIEKKELSNYQNVPVIRLPQLVDWIYEKGRIGEDKWNEIKKYSNGGPVVTKENWKAILDNSRGFVVASLTLEVMEEFDINQKLLDMGAALFIEEYTAEQIYYHIRNIEFEAEVSQWQKQLAREITENSRFVEVRPNYRKEEIEGVISENLYLEAAYAPAKCCHEKNLYLLTDDRWTEKIFPRHFVTAALLRDLFDSGIIDMEEYTRAFLELCKWRYRFLLPDVRILLFLAEQYRNNLPGKDLEFIASYLRKNMENPGLSLTIELTTPPTPIAWNYFLVVIDTWYQFLAGLWQKDTIFEEKKLTDITGWFFRCAMPDIPKVINEEIRDRLYGSLEYALSSKLFSLVITTTNHKKLHRFLSISLGNIFENPEKREGALIDFIKFVKNIEFPPNTRSEVKNAMATLCAKILETFFGTDWPEPMTAVGKIPKLAAELSDIIHLEIDMEHEDIKNSIRLLADYFQNRENIPEYDRITPLIVTRQTPTEIAAYLLHELIKVPEIEIKKIALKRIADADYITDLTKSKIENLKERMISAPAAYRQEASEEAAKLLLKDFYYVKACITKLKEKQFMGWRQELLDALLTPDLLTVTWKSPLLINENLALKVIELRIREQINNASYLNTFLDWFLEECYFVPLGHPLNPWEFVREFIRKRKMSCREALYFLKKWVEANRHPMAYLMALDIVLSLRSKSASEELEKVEFKSEEFFKFLTQMLEVLLIDKSESVSMDGPLFKNIKERWHFRTELSRYYLKYMDLNLNEPADDEYKVLLAWWMARDVEKTLIENFTMLSLEEQTLWLKQNVDIIKMERPVNFEHFVRYREKALSIARYYTMVKSSPLTTSTLTLSVINPKGGQEYAFKGLKEPTLAFNPKFTDAIINSLPQETLWGEEQILYAQKGQLPFLWELPFCISAPGFLRAYYEDAFEFLGKDKVEIIEFAEAISAPDFLKNDLGNLSNMPEEDKKVKAPFLLCSLETYVQLHGEMSLEAVIFKEHKELIKELMTITTPLYNVLCFQRIISILNKMISVGNSEWVEVFRHQLKDLDYDELAEQLNQLQFELLQDHIFRIVMLGYDLSILNPIVQRKTTSKAIREILGRVKSILESNVTLVPIENRENLRKFLNQIADVPAILEKNKNGG